MPEVIAISLDDVKAINQSKATQVELCADIDHEGLSPSIELIKAAIKVTTKKIKVMLRFHHNNFLVNNKQLKEIVTFINKTKDLDFDGYVFGAINNHQAVDFKSLSAILQVIGNKTMTFHKAIDTVKDIAGSINGLTSHDQINYILTSGGQGNPEVNVHILQAINHKSKVLLGGGVSMHTIKALKPLGFKNFHVGRATRENNSYENPIRIKQINELVDLINNSE